MRGHREQRGAKLSEGPVPVWERETPPAPQSTRLIHITAWSLCRGNTQVHGDSPSRPWTPVQPGVSATASQRPPSVAVPGSNKVPTPLLNRQGPVRSQLPAQQPCFCLNSVGRRSSGSPQEAPGWWEVVTPFAAHSRAGHACKSPSTVDPLLPEFWRQVQLQVPPGSTWMTEQATTLAHASPSQVGHASWGLQHHRATSA